MIFSTRAIFLVAFCLSSRTVLGIDSTLTTSPTECDGVDLTVDLLTDGWGNEVSWIVTKDGQTILSSDGDETYGNYKPYTSSTCVPAECDGDYTFSIFDSFGDGFNTTSRESQ